MGGTDFIYIFTDADSQLACTTSCPPDAAHSSLATTDNDLLIYAHADHADSVNTEEDAGYIQVCVAECGAGEFIVTDKDGQLRCITACPATDNSVDFFDSSVDVWLFSYTNADGELECLTDCPDDKPFHDFSATNPECLTDCAAQSTTNSYFRSVRIGNGDLILSHAGQADVCVISCTFAAGSGKSHSWTYDVAENSFNCNGGGECTIYTIDHSTQSLSSATSVANIPDDTQGLYLKSVIGILGLECVTSCPFLFTHLTKICLDACPTGEIIVY